MILDSDTERRRRTQRRKSREIFGAGEYFFLRRKGRTEKEREANIMEKEKLLRYGGASKRLYGSLRTLTKVNQDYFHSK